MLIRASPCEKSKEKGKRQKVKFVCLNMKENKATGHKSVFLASLFCFLEPFLAILGLGQKMPIFYDQISKNYFISLKTKLYSYVTHDPNFNVYL